MTRRVAVCAAMRQELRPLVRSLGLRPTSLGARRVFVGSVGDLQVVAIVSSMGTRNARAAATDLLSSFPVEWLVVVGISGGMGDVRVGDLHVPEVVIDGATGAELRPDPLEGLPAAGVLHTADELLMDREHLAALSDRGVNALDMETAAFGAAAIDHGVSWGAVRAISDHIDIDDVDEAIFGLIRPDGSADPAAVARFVATHPGRVPQLARLAKGQRAAIVASTRAVDAWVRRL